MDKDGGWDTEMHGHPQTVTMDKDVQILALTGKILE